MILGQLIQTGRRFCECRSRDFIPESSDRIVTLSYSQSDRFIGRSMEMTSLDLEREIHEWLESTQAIAYILITRHIKNNQRELPAPIGRTPMDTLTITAATPSDLSYATYHIETVKGVDACRLIPTNRIDQPHRHTFRNHFETPASHEFQAHRITNPFAQEVSI